MVADIQAPDLGDQNSFSFCCNEKWKRGVAIDEEIPFTLRKIFVKVNVRELLKALNHEGQQNGNRLKPFGTGKKIFPLRVLSLQLSATGEKIAELKYNFTILH